MSNFLFYWLLSILLMIFLVMMVMIGVSFLTLLERKVLGLIQLRKGPNKILYKGVFQPFSDAIKLFSKEFFFIFSLFKFYYLLCPLMILLTSMLSWAIFPVVSNIYSFNLGILFMFCCFSFSSYPLMLAGWSSMSIYPLLGSVRSCAQVISYEVSFIIIILSLIFMGESYGLYIFMKLSGVGNYLYMFPIFLMFFISMLAELNRMPFDFIEGESELVSGFNTEYFGVGFSLIFMGEYCSIMFMGMIFILLFFNFLIDSPIYTILFQLMMCVVIMVRGAVPRMRYDELMFLCWKIFLPMSLNYLFFVLGFKWLINILVM